MRMFFINNSVNHNPNRKAVDLSETTLPHDLHDSVDGRTIPCLPLLMLVLGGAGQKHKPIRRVKAMLWLGIPKVSFHGTTDHLDNEGFRI